VKTKRKLLEECDVYCIVSLPGGVFSSAGAGVKTNLVFFTKGQPTERIWYYDLADVKVGKKTPFTLRHFDAFFEHLSKRTDSERSWTVDFAGRQQKAMDEARPTANKLRRCWRQAKQQETEWREKRKEPQAREELAARWKETLRQQREAAAKQTPSRTPSSISRPSIRTAFRRQTLERPWNC